MKLIPLTQGKFAMVDNTDFDALNEFKWFAQKRENGSFHAARHFRKPDGKLAYQYMHQFLFPGVAELDHRDGNGLNNQRYNLRPASRQQNCRGFKRKRPGATSKYRGVSWESKRLKWITGISVDGKNKFLGYYTSEIEAAIARDKAALKYYGPDAHFNFPI